MNGNELIVAPCALNPIMARIAEDAGFRAVYMSGGSLGWLKCVTEANLALPELAEIAVDMRAVCQLPIILDAGGGWGDPMHVHRTIALTQAAGFAAIEIEDQLLPRRVEHHIGIDNLVTTELMVDKVKEAIAARSDPGLVIIARTNSRRVHDLDEALRRAEAFHRAGADMLFIHSRDAEEMRIVGERLPPPLMTFAPPDGFATFAMSRSEMTKLGSPGGVVGHLVRRHVQGGAPIHGVPRRGQGGPVPRPRRRRSGNGAGAPDDRARPPARHRAANDEESVGIALR
jgi:2-methylisocitrate lyase-like PEP mutase family enzyme